LTGTTCQQFSKMRSGRGQFARYQQGSGLAFICPGCHRPACGTAGNSWFIQRPSSEGAIAQGPGATAVAPGAVYRAGGVHGEVINTGTGNVSGNQKKPGTSW
jgi:hypothetical protein